MRTGPGPDDGYETSVYRTGHVVGADNGTTRTHNVDCHATPTPRTLPHTGATQDVLIALAAGLVLVGLTLVWVTRREARKGSTLSDGGAS